jgi:hypothetical protein
MTLDLTKQGIFRYLVKSNRDVGCALKDILESTVLNATSTYVWSRTEIVSINLTTEHKTFKYCEYL